MRNTEGDSDAATELRTNVVIALERATPSRPENRLAT
jgi:hypothetical protein